MAITALVKPSASKLISVRVHSVTPPTIGINDSRILVVKSSPRNTRDSATAKIGDVAWIELIESDGEDDRD